MYMASTRIIEERAVNTLKSVLLNCPFLMPFIDTNDKTPSWDGTIFVYKDERQRNEDLIGRASIQVKGTSNEIRTETSSFSCKMSDLRNYYNDGGTILFLVSEVPLLTLPNIYYVCLSVVDLKKILDQYGKQNSYAVHLRRLPVTNPSEIATIIAAFIEDAKKQKSFVGKDILTLEQLKEKGVDIECLTFNAVGVSKAPVDIGRFISTHEFFIYAKPRGLDVEIPIDKIICPSATKQINGTVKVEDRVYYQSYFVEYNNGSPTIVIGKGIRALIDADSHSISLSYKPKGTLDDYICDTKCFIDMIEHGQISINGASLCFNVAGNGSIDSKKESLRYYEDVKRVLDYLGVTERLNCDQLTEADEKKIRDIVFSVLYNKKLTVTGTESPVIYGAYEIANLSIWVWTERDEAGLYQIYNFFENHDVATFDEEDTEHISPIPSSHYLLLSKEAFAHTSNINYTDISKSICSLSHCELLQSGVNNLMLSALNGYDSQKIKDSRILDLCDTIIEWMAVSEEEREEAALFLNRMQIIKRRRALSTNEKIEIGKLTGDEYDDMIRCGAYLLLDDSEEAQKCFDKLPDDAKKYFLTFPICNFGNIKYGGEQ